MATALTEMMVYPDLTLSPNSKLVARRCLYDNLPFLDIRVHIKYQNKDTYIRTKKGLFLSETRWKEIVLPFLNQVFPSQNCNTVPEK